MLTGTALLLAATVFALAATARAEGRAATLAQYRQRVAEARAAVESLEEVEDAAALARVRGLLPRGERVEWAGAVVVVDNGWLHDALDYAQAADEQTPEQRADVLASAAARLRALEARLAEAEAPAPPRDKEAEKGRLNTILRRPEYGRQEKQGDALRRLAERLFEWLRELIPDIKPLRPGTSGGLSRAAQILIFALSGVVLALVVWRFWSRRERGPKSARTRAARVVLGEQLEADQTAADLLEEAERLALAGDLRAAIRKAYVALLCELGDRRVIGLARHKTNRDYLRAVREGAPRLYPALLPLTADFELHWYGAHDATESDWADFRARCRRALALARS